LSARRFRPFALACGWWFFSCLRHSAPLLVTGLSLRLGIKKGPGAGPLVLELLEAAAAPIGRSR
jgi:hypothetical protein